MSLITVKPKFQVTIPVKLRESIGLHEGDLMEATVVDDGIFLRPMEVIDRNTIANRIETLYQGIKPSAEDAGRSEDEIMEETINDIAKARRQKRNSKA